MPPPETERIEIEAKAKTSDNVRIAEYDVTPFLERFERWLEWPRHTRKRYLEHLAEPEHVGTISNVTCTGLHEYLALALTLSAGEASDLDPPGELAFGDDDSSFDTSDTALNNEVGNRITITDRSSDGADFIVDEYLASTEQNGNTIRELAIFSVDGTMYQHSATAKAYEKDATKALIISITVPIADAN